MKQYIVDAFTDTVFKGNPAAVCIMDSWIDDDLMLSITRENNLSETAFAVKENENIDCVGSLLAEKSTFVDMLLWRQPL